MLISIFEHKLCYITFSLLKAIVILFLTDDLDRTKGSMIKPILFYQMWVVSLPTWQWKIHSLIFNFELPFPRKRWYKQKKSVT